MSRPCFIWCVGRVVKRLVTSGVCGDTDRLALFQCLNCVLPFVDVKEIQQLQRGRTAVSWNHNVDRRKPPVLLPHLEQLSLPAKVSSCRSQIKTKNKRNKQTNKQKTQLKTKTIIKKLKQTKTN